MKDALMLNAFFLALSLTSTLTPQALDSDIEAALHAAQDSVPEARFILRVETGSPEMTLVLSSDPEINPADRFRIASNTKTWVAAALLRLAEDGHLDLDAPITSYLSPETLALLESGGYAPDQITVRQLASHTAGLGDHTQTDAFFEAIVANPMRVWTPAQQIELAMTESRKLSEPGIAYAYSDTGYVLLGEIIEQVSGLPLAPALRTLVDYDDLGLDHTWLETLEPAPAPAPAALEQGAVGLKTADLHPSMDLYGGGGLVSTLEDMNTFYRALIEGEILGEETLSDMMRASPQSRTEGGYGLGLFVHEIAGETCYGHAGFWGSLAYHCPEIDLTLSGAVTDQSGYGALTELIHQVIALTAETEHNLQP